MHAGIRAGVVHLHGFGLVHNDLAPQNVVVKRDGSDPVIMDLDCCREEGEKLGPRRGSNRWAKPGITHARKDNDLWSLEKIRGFLVEAEAAAEETRACLFFPRYYKY